MSTKRSDRIRWCPECDRPYSVPAGAAMSARCLECDRAQPAVEPPPAIEPQGNSKNHWKPAALVCLGMLLAIAAQLIVSETRNSADEPTQSATSSRPENREAPAPPPVAVVAAAANEVPADEPLPDLPPVPPADDAWPEWKLADVEPPKRAPHLGAAVPPPAAVQVMPVVIQQPPIEFPKGPDPLLVSRVERFRVQAAQLREEIQTLTADRQRVWNEGRSVYASGSRVSNQAAAIRSQFALVESNIRQYEVVMLNGTIIRDERILALKQYELAKMREQRTVLERSLAPLEIEAERLRTQFMALDAEARSLYTKIRQKTATLTRLIEVLDQAEAELRSQN